MKITSQLKCHLWVIGSTTKLTGAISFGTWASSAIVSGANDASVHDLTIENTGGGTYSVALYSNSSSPVIQDVTAIALGGTHNFGVFNDSSSSTMINLTATASGGTSSFGVNNYSVSSPTMTNVVATATGGTSTNYGVANNISSPTMTNVTATANGGEKSFGVQNIISGTVMTNVTAKASNGTSENHGISNIDSPSLIMANVNVSAKGSLALNYGIYNENSVLTIRQSEIVGNLTGIFTTTAGGENNISHSTIYNGFFGGTNTCILTDNGQGVVYQSGCAL